MTIENMKAKIIDTYGGLDWERRVLKMSDEQIIAIYNNMLRSGKFDKKPNRRKGRQLTLYD